MEILGVGTGASRNTEISKLVSCIFFDSTQTCKKVNSQIIVGHVVTTDSRQGRESERIWWKTRQRLLTRRSREGCDEQDSTSKDMTIKNTDRQDMSNKEWIIYKRTILYITERDAVQRTTFYDGLQPLSAFFLYLM